MLFVGDAIFPGGNDYPVKTLGLDTVSVRDPRETRAVIDTIIACLKVARTAGAIRHASAASDRAQSVLGAQA